jgi:Leucine-rich repeat (LRR) protein
MNIKITLAILLFSVGGLAQCVKCKSLSEAEKDPKKVTSLLLNSYLNNDELEKVPASIFTFTNIQELFFTDYGFTEIPKEIGLLTQLKILSFAGNNLTQVPDEIFKLTQLKELILVNNQFSDEYIEQLEKKAKEKLPNTRVML